MWGRAPVHCSHFLLLPAPALPDPKSHLSSPPPVPHLTGLFHQHPIQLQILPATQLSFRHCFSHHISGLLSLFSSSGDFVLAPLLSQSEFSLQTVYPCLDYLLFLPPFSSHWLLTSDSRLTSLSNCAAPLTGSQSSSLCPSSQPGSPFLSGSFLSPLLPVLIPVLSFLTQTP